MSQTRDNDFDVKKEEQWEGIAVSEADPNWKAAANRYTAT